MKTKFTTTIKSILFTALTLLILTAVGQERNLTNIKYNHNEPSLRSEQKSARGKISIANNHKSGQSSINQKGEIDTLNFPLNGDYTLYITDNGYVSGNNEFLDKAKADYFNIDQPKLLYGLFIDFAVATGTGNVEIVIWDNNGSGGSPGGQLAVTPVPMANIINDVQNNFTTYIELNNPIVVESSFYAGVLLPSNANDTIAIWTNSDGDSNPGTAWEQWSDNNWVRYDEENNWELSISHAIFPIVNSEIGLQANFTSNTTNVNPNQTINFFDNSIGNPVSWEWTFEGGDPETSAEQNPTILYTEIGTFDVKLKVSDGTSTDSVTMIDYITVSEVSPSQIDTLNFPLPGDFALYVYESPASGYVTGTNSYNDLAKANFFYNNIELKITGILVDFAVAEGSSSNIEFVIWNNNGDGNIPNSIISSATIPFNSIVDDVNSQQLSYVEFDPPVIIDHSFYAGIMLPTESSADLALWSNTDGDITPGIAWEMWDTNEWFDMSFPPAVELNIVLAIHPVVDYDLGIWNNSAEQTLNIFPNPTNGIIQIETREINHNATIEIYSTSGILVMEQQINDINENSNIDLTEHENGMYVIKLIDSNKIYYSKIIKY